MEPFESSRAFLDKLFVQILKVLVLPGKIQCYSFIAVAGGIIYCQRISWSFRIMHAKFTNGINLFRKEKK